MVFTVGNLFFSWPRPLFFHGFGGSWYITLRIEVCSLEGSLPSTFRIENPIPSGGEFDLSVGWAYGLSKHFGRFCLDLPFLQVPREDEQEELCRKLRATCGGCENSAAWHTRACGQRRNPCYGPRTSWHHGVQFSCCCNCSWAKAWTQLDTAFGSWLGSMGCNPMPGIVDFWDFGIWGGWTPLIRMLFVK